MSSVTAARAFWCASTSGVMHSTSFILISPESIRPDEYSASMCASFASSFCEGVGRGRGAVLAKVGAPSKKGGVVCVCMCVGGGMRGPPNPGNGRPVVAVTREPPRHLGGPSTGTDRYAAATRRWRTSKKVIHWYGMSLDVSPPRRRCSSTVSLPPEKAYLLG